MLPPLITAYMWNQGKPATYLRLNVFPRWTSILNVTLIMLVAIPFINLLSWLNQQVVFPSYMSGIADLMRSSEDQIAELTQRILNVTGIDQLLFNLLVVAVVPALSEELFFRGSIQNILSVRCKNTLAIWLTAIFFSTIHMQFYGFVPRMLLGAFFGYLVVWSGSLWLPIIAHFVNNAVSVIFYYLVFNGYKLPDIDKTGTENTLWLGFLSGFITIGLIVWFYKNTQIKPGNPMQKETDN
jgi:membrane protease YdiL (CAAX protease family)